MKLFRTSIFAAALLIGAALVATLGPVQRAVSQGMLQITNLTGAEQISLNYPCTVSCFATSAAIASYGQSLPGGNYDNALIGGDSDSNLYQRGTTGASVTTTLTYGGPDRWAYWSGTNTAMTVSRTTTAGDLPAVKTYGSGFKMARTNGQTGVVQVCMMQVLETAQSYRFSGQTAELDFHATAGATFTGAASKMKAYLITGTGTDEGAVNAAFGLNAAGGGAAGWTGQANLGVDVTISTTNARYTVAAPVPAGTTEIAIALCWTPVGTAGANDYIAFSGIQLTANSTLSTAAGTAGVALTNDSRAKVFARRPVADESELQQRYYFQLTETAAITPVSACAAIDTTHTNCMIRFPTSMRTVPTMTYANGFATPTTTSQATLGACTTLGSSDTVSSVAASNVNNVLVKCTATTVPAAGVASYLYSNNGSGKIQASAEL